MLAKASEEILGFSHCRGCQDLHPSFLLGKSSGWCPACIDLKMHEYPVIVARTTNGFVQMGKRRRPRTGSRGKEETARTTRAARRAAASRVAALLPDLYAYLLGQERASRGLEPHPLEACRNLNVEKLDLTMKFVEATYPSEQSSIAP